MFLCGERHRRFPSFLYIENQSGEDYPFRFFFILLLFCISIIIILIKLNLQSNQAGRIYDEQRLHYSLC